MRSAIESSGSLDHLCLVCELDGKLLPDIAIDLTQTYGRGVFHFLVDPSDGVREYMDLVEYRVMGRKRDHVMADPLIDPRIEGDGTCRSSIAGRDMTDDDRSRV